MFSASYSAGLSGIEGFPVTVECNQRKGLEGFELVGLPDAAVKEAKERVRTACVNSGYPFPYGYITVNLAPADRRKEGSAFDAAILTAILHSAGVIKKSVSLAGRTALSCGQESVPATPLHGCRSAGTSFRNTTGFSGKGR